MSLNQEQQMIRDSASEFLTENSNSECIRTVIDAQAVTEPAGYDEAQWQTISQEMGWCGLVTPEEAGGIGLGMTELCLVMEEMGKHLSCTPFFASGVVATLVLRHAVEADKAQPHLEALATGEKTATVLMPASAMQWNSDCCTITAKADGAHYVLSGVVEHVFAAQAANTLIVPAQLEDGTLTLFALDAKAEGVSVTPLASLDPTRQLANVQLNKVRGTATDRIAKDDALPTHINRALQLASLALAAEQLGGADACLDLSIAYTSERVQFGRTIASYQAIKHRCAEMMVKIESSRAAIYGAAGAWDKAESDNAQNAALADIAAARALVTPAYTFCAQEAIQLHGGVGFTWEYDPHLYFKRAHASTQWLGGAKYATQFVIDHIDSGAALAKQANDDEPLRAEVADWMQANLKGEFACLAERGGPGDDEAYPELRKKWEQHLAKNGWTGIGWPKEHGGRGYSVWEQVIFQEEYAKAGGPGRMGHIGEGLVAPTIIAFGTDDQKERLLPGILNGTEFWCQGYSEPSAGSDLGNVRTKAVQDDDGNWRITGQKVWTSWALESDWVFVLARTEAGSKGNKGLGFFLMELNQPNIEIRPIRQITGGSEFNEVFFEEAICKQENMLGKPGEGWKIAMALLGFERGISTLGQQMQFIRELQWIVELAKENGSWDDENVRKDLANAWAGLRVMRYAAMQMLSGADDGNLGREALIYKYYWSNWHRDLGELAMRMLGDEANLLDGKEDSRKTRLQNVFLFARSDTIYAGTNEIQLNIMSERGLKMPREPRGDI